MQHLTPHRRVGIVNVNVQLPEWLRDEIHLLLLDPRTGRVPRGAWSIFMETAVANHIATMKPVPVEPAE